MNKKFSSHFYSVIAASGSKPSKKRKGLSTYGHLKSGHPGHSKCHVLYCVKLYGYMYNGPVVVLSFLLSKDLLVLIYADRLCYVSTSFKISFVFH